MVSSQVTEHLISTISQLQAENDMLKEKLKTFEATELDSSLAVGEGKHHQPCDDTKLPLFESLSLVEQEVNHRIYDLYYLDTPRMFKGDTKKNQPRGAIEVEKAEAYLRNHTNLSFVVVEIYRFDKTLVEDIFDKVGQISGRLLADSTPLKMKSREICLGPRAKEALNSIITTHPDRFSGFQKIVEDHQLWHTEPYLFFYVHNKTAMELQDTSGLDELETQALQALLTWMEDNCRQDWDEADALFAQGKVNLHHFSKLFLPGELIVSENRGEHRGVITATQACDYYTDKRMMHKTQYFDGEFFTTSEIIPHFPRVGESARMKKGFSARTDSADVPVAITSLNAYPIRFAEEGLEAKLIARGHKFWRFRSKSVVCYNEVEEGDYYQTERRYMIDYAMYKRLHSAKPRPRNSFKPTYSDAEEPSEAILACFPPMIHGFDFSKKSWQRLRVDHLTDVTWNKTAFEQLVAPDETKELIQAMVTIHGQQSSTAQDIIDGKGQGLLILLHGGPGTGKTLTAESIAEVQERPLYRVTCGDIGIEPKDVEQYLGDVLEIGKSWGCVVLLDEADVFLEERSFTDQKRNAVISIFLRILEYYDGILILTTNRVGSFDEAFNPSLPPTQRGGLKIWQNFMKMLPRSGQRIDMEDLQMNLHKLALVEINGRQIRNAVTMARHLAKFRHEMLRYKHMQDALRSVQRFNEYLNDVKGFRDDEWARADKLR
ncbi:hypothetical protein QQZ08_010443 [Neonectria magnoliae]|uniref:AAA+ ATPase domain-containing protein n=1 Tax=Neonectria magnoliae TaxID=2732573 RepID=A0ABR1HGP1_9HYPO